MELLSSLNNVGWVEMAYSSRFVSRRLAEGAALKRKPASSPFAHFRCRSRFTDKSHQVAPVVPSISSILLFPASWMSVVFVPAHGPHGNIADLFVGTCPASIPCGPPQVFNEVVNELDGLWNFDICGLNSRDGCGCCFKSFEEYSAYLMRYAVYSLVCETCCRSLRWQRFDVLAYTSVYFPRYIPCWKFDEWS